MAKVSHHRVFCSCSRQVFNSLSRALIVLHGVLWRPLHFVNLLDQSLLIMIVPITHGVTPRLLCLVPLVVLLKRRFLKFRIHKILLNLVLFVPKSAPVVY